MLVAKPAGQCFVTDALESDDCVDAAVSSLWIYGEVSEACLVGKAFPELRLWKPTHSAFLMLMLPAPWRDWSYVNVAQGGMACGR